MGPFFFMRGRSSPRGSDPPPCPEVESPLTPVGLGQASDPNKMMVPFDTAMRSGLWRADIALLR